MHDDNGATPLYIAAQNGHEVVVGQQGETSGSLSFAIGAGNESLPKSLPLGKINASRATARTAAGTGEALLFGGRDGGIFIATPAAGTYACEWSLPAVSASAGSLCVLPLVPGLHTEIIIWAPRGQRPLVAGGAAVRQPERSEGPLPEAETDSSVSLQAWRIEVGPLPALHFTLVPLATGMPRLATWRALEIRGREVVTTMTVQPVEPWTGRTLVLEKDPEVSLLDIRTPGGTQTGSLVWQELPGGQSLEIDLPYPLPEVEGDAPRLTQVFVNLLANAIEYSPEGGDVEIATARAGDRWVVRVVNGAAAGRVDAADAGQRPAQVAAVQ
jgi:hypothetical protein